MWETKVGMNEHEIYHKSHIRSNILECIDWAQCKKVLEISGEEGALTGTLASKVDKVTCLVSDKEACRRNQAHNEQYQNIEYIQKNLRSAMAGLEESFDVIVSIVPCGLSLDDLLPYAERLLNAGGKLIFACDNRLGLKYLAGCQKEPEGGYFTGIQGMSGERLYLRRELEKKMMDEAEQWDYEMFYPYPDQYYPMTIYSDKYLPKIGELNANGIISKHARFVLFNEEMAYDTILKEGMYAEMTNAFLLVMTRR